MTLAKTIIEEIRITSRIMSVLIADAAFWVKEFLHIFLITTIMIVPMDALLPITKATIYNNTPIPDIFSDAMLYVEVLELFGKAYSCNGHKKRLSKRGGREIKEDNSKKE